MQLDQIRAVVTGGASGLGLATATRIIANGGRAVLLDVGTNSARPPRRAIEARPVSSTATSPMKQGPRPRSVPPRSGSAG